MDYSALMEAYSATLSARLQATRAALKHPGQKGTAAEVALMELLKETLPKRIGITEGVVVSSSGFVSPQQDIILYDSEASPILFQAGATKAIPIEYVHAVIEVKSSLAAADVRAFSNRNIELRSQQKFFVGDTDPKGPRKAGYTYHQAGREWHAPPINAFMFAYECSSPDAIWNEYKACHSPEMSYSQWIDSICIPQTAFFSRRTDKNGLGDTIAIPASLIWIREMPLLAFVAQLWLMSVEWRVLERPAIFRYLKHYSFLIEKSAPFVGVVTHPDCKPDGS